jgi:hypothetical protein
LPGSPADGEAGVVERAVVPGVAEDSGLGCARAVDGGAETAGVSAGPGPGAGDGLPANA